MSTDRSGNGLARQLPAVAHNGWAQETGEFGEGELRDRGRDSTGFCRDLKHRDDQQVALERQEVREFLRAEGGRLAHPTTLAVLTDSGIQIESASTRHFCSRAACHCSCSRLAAKRNQKKNEATTSAAEHTPSRTQSDPFLASVHHQLRRWTNLMGAAGLVRDTRKLWRSEQTQPNATRQAA